MLPKTPGRATLRRLRRCGLRYLLLTALAGALVGCSALGPWPFSCTGESDLMPQAKALLQLVFDQLRPKPVTADYVPVAETGLSPFGVNTFLEQEVEPAKREQSVRMIAEAGFHWVRQEFPWEDIEIHGKGDFEDRRHSPSRSAWEKYDQIVDLADTYGLELIVRLGNPPAWSRAAGNALGSFAPPDDYDDFGDFVATVVDRYRGRIRYYQLWNEPNIYPEWGEAPVDPSAYVELLKIGYTRAKSADPNVVNICGAMASTIELDYRNLNDFAFLQQMYDAGASAYFDILAMQGYGLWSGPTDRRMGPRVVNFSRPRYIRDIMVRNGDAGKPIWISEMNWNAVPDRILDRPYGQVTPEEQAQYVTLAYQRLQREWPWLGVANLWFFKRATDVEIDQPMYYFRMVEPDFTPLPLYAAISRQTREQPIVHLGYHQEDHWALRYTGDWKDESSPSAILGSYRAAEADAELAFTFEGRALELVAPSGPMWGRFSITVDGGPPQEVELKGEEERWGQVVWHALWASAGPHEVVIRPQAERMALDGVIVRPWPAWARGGLLAVVGALVLLAGLISLVRRRRRGVV